MNRNKKVLLSLGSNMGDREAQIEKACKKLSDFLTILKRSPNFYSPAMGFKGGEFINIALVGETQLSPDELLERVQEIEKQQGKIQRHRSQPYQSRLIDIDIIFYESKIVQNGNLEIPHPEMHNRDFVLIPASEIEPEWMHPKFHKTILELKSECDVHSH